MINIRVITVLLLAGLLTTTLFAQEASAPTLNIEPNAQAELYTLTYTGQAADDLQIRIVDQSGIVFFKESFEQTGTITRNYRLQDVEPGDYTFEVSSSTGVVKENVAFPIAQPLPEAPFLAVNKVDMPEGARYYLTVSGAPEENVVVRVYDRWENLLYEAETTVAEQSQKLFNFDRTFSDKVLVSVSRVTESGSASTLREVDLR